MHFSRYIKRPVLHSDSFNSIQSYQDEEIHHISRFNRIDGKFEIIDYFLSKFNQIKHEIKY